MIIRIKDLLSAPQFERIVFFFEENGMVSIEDLKGYDFNSLFFIPGISDEVLIDAKSILQKNLNYSADSGGNNSVHSEDRRLLVSDNILLKTQPEKNINDFAGKEPVDKDKPASEKKFELGISDVFYSIPSGDELIERANRLGKRKIRELEENDFYQILEGVYGFGIKKIKKFIKVWKTFMEIENNPALRNQFFMNKVFGHLKHGKLFIKRCYEQGYESLSDLLSFDFKVDNSRGIGRDAMEEIEQTFLDSLNKPEIINELTADKIEEYKIKRLAPHKKRFQNENFINLLNGNIRVSVSEELLDIKISYAFQSILNGNVVIDHAHACEKVWISELVENDFLICLGNNRGRWKKKVVQLIEEWQVLLEINSLESLKGYLHASFDKKIALFDERSLFCLEEKIQGATLEEIGHKIGVTRERVRQIISRITRETRSQRSMIGDVLLENHGRFDEQDVLSFFRGDDRLTRYFFFLTKKSDIFHYFRFSNVFVRKSLVPSSIYITLEKIAYNLFKDGAFYYDQLESIESALEQNNISFITLEDFKNFLIETGYVFYDDYVTRERTSYAHACYSIILKYFDFDVQLQQLKSSDDMKRIRDIVSDNFPDIELPDSDRALTGRLSDYLILSGRGRFCPIEKVVYNPEIFEDLYNFIWDSKQTSFYYSELFSMFKGRFLFETNIGNASFLHGMMKYLYPTDFSYERDLLIKKGQKRMNADDRMNEIALHADWSISKGQILNELPGIHDWTITQAGYRLSQVIQWNDNEYIHTSKLLIRDEDRERIDCTISEALTANNGYASEKMVYRKAMENNPEFCRINNIESSQSFFYLAAWLFSDKYTFKKPHVFSNDLQIDEVSSIKLVDYLLGNPSRLNSKDLTELKNKFEWPESYSAVVFKKYLNEFIRIDKVDYIKRKFFIFSERTIEAVRQYVSLIIPKSGYLAIASITDYSTFPVLEKFEWNGFLLQSILEMFAREFRIISPKSTDYRSLRGIIVRAELGVRTFEKLVVGIFKGENIKEITEEGFIKLLTRKGLLVTNNLPQEFYASDCFHFKNELFYFLGN
jgi:hypothetical protein